MYTTGASVWYCNIIGGTCIERGGLSCNLPPQSTVKCYPALREAAYVTGKYTRCFTVQCKPLNGGNIGAGHVGRDLRSFLEVDWLGNHENQTLKTLI